MSRRAVLWVASLLVMPCAFGAPAVDPFASPVTDEAQLRSALSRPEGKLLKAQVFEGQFQHSRHLREIPRPLIATGEFTVVRDLGVYWHTRQPFDSIVVLTGAGLVQSDEGAPAQRISAAEQPAVRLIANIFMSLFTLDTTRLSRDFDLYGGKHGERWIIGLKPRTKAIAAVFSRATVSGAEDVEQVVLTDSQGDRTVIDLRAITYSSDPPDADVRALFAPSKP
jgi:hypothetical protein